MAFEPAHGVVDVLRHQRHAVGRWRVRRDEAAFRRRAEELPPGVRDVFAEQGRFREVELGAGLNQNLADLLEVEQPVGQLQRARSDHLGAIAQGVGVLVVRIQHDQPHSIAAGDDGGSGPLDVDALDVE